MYDLSLSGLTHLDPTTVVLVEIETADCIYHEVAVIEHELNLEEWDTIAIRVEGLGVG